MHSSSILSVAVLFATGAFAFDNYQKVSVNHQGLVARQQQDGFCTGVSCSACFGPGNVICDGNMCFNPSGGEECCTGGLYCLGKGCCGSTGNGVTGIDGVPGGVVASPTTTPGSALTGSSSAVPTGSSTWTCRADQSVQECCAGGGTGSVYCSGNYPLTRCYKPSQNEECCSNGIPCIGTGCCAQSGASAISPTAPASTSRQTTARASTTSSRSTGTQGGSPPSSTQTGGATTQSSDSSAGKAAAFGSGAALALGVVGLLRVL